MNQDCGIKEHLLIYIKKIIDIKTKRFKAFHIIQNLLSPFFPLGFGRFQIICKVLVQQINKIQLAPISQCLPLGAGSKASLL